MIWFVQAEVWFNLTKGPNKDSELDCYMLKCGQLCNYFSNSKPIKILDKNSNNVWTVVVLVFWVTLTFPSFTENIWSLTLFMWILTSVIYDLLIDLVSCHVSIRCATVCERCTAGAFSSSGILTSCCLNVELLLLWREVWQGQSQKEHTHTHTQLFVIQLVACDWWQRIAARMYVCVSVSLFAYTGGS